MAVIHYAGILQCLCHQPLVPGNKHVAYLEAALPLRDSVGAGHRRYGRSFNSAPSFFTGIKSAREMPSHITMGLATSTEE